MHYFNEDVSRCFSEQAKVFSKELNLPLNAGREVWARIHGCDNAHEALQKIKNDDPVFCESVIASLRTLGRFPRDSFVEKFSPYFRRGEGSELNHDGLKDIGQGKVEQAALRAKGIPRRWSIGLNESRLIDEENGHQGLLSYQLVNQGGIYLSVEGKGVDRLFGLFQKTSNYRRQRRVKGVFLGFPEWINNDNFIHNIRSEKVFDVWTLQELELLFKKQLVPRGKNDSEASMWADRAYVAAKSILGLISIACEDLRIHEISSRFNLDAVLEMREKVVQDGRETDPKSAKIIERVTQFLWSLPGFTEEDCALENLNPECYKQFGFLSMQLTSFIDALTEDNSIQASNLFPDMAIPSRKELVDEYFEKLNETLKSLPDYSFAFVDIRKDGMSKEVVERIIEACRKRRIYAIWCGGASVEEQEVMQNFYEDLFEITEGSFLRPYF